MRAKEGAGWWERLRRGCRAAGRQDGDAPLRHGEAHRRQKQGADDGREPDTLPGRSARAPESPGHQAGEENDDKASDKNIRKKTPEIRKWIHHLRHHLSLFAAHPAAERAIE